MSNLLTRIASTVRLCVGERRMPVTETRIVSFWPASIAAIVLRSNLYSARMPVTTAIVRESVGICGGFYQRRQHDSIHSRSLAR